ncbi:hypothetical protein [Corynebacterium mastitidis]|nr:hypothetical protein [Corynebacterium mastitidis]
MRAELDFFPETPGIFGKNAATARKNVTETLSIVSLLFRHGPPPGGPHHF